MSERTVYSIIKGVSPDRARALIKEAARALPGPRPKHSKWSDWTYGVRPKKMVALACGDSLVISSEAWRLADEIARLVDSPTLELRVQEGDHWDFTLFHRAEVIADFSTRVSYFDYDSTASGPWKQGDAMSFSTTWNVPLEQISPYLIDWDSLPTPHFVADDDEFSTDDWRQVFDFMRAIGVDYPDEHPDRFHFEVPSWEGTYIVQPLWRRVVRRISVWIKGTYPDAPRRTREQREAIQRRISSIRIVTMDLDDLKEQD